MKETCGGKRDGGGCSDLCTIREFPKTVMNRRNRADALRRHKVWHGESIRRILQVARGRVREEKLKKRRGGARCDGAGREV